MYKLRRKRFSLPMVRDMVVGLLANQASVRSKDITDSVGAKFTNFDIRNALGRFSDAGYISRPYKDIGIQTYRMIARGPNWDAFTTCELPNIYIDSHQREMPMREEEEEGAQPRKPLKSSIIRDLEKYIDGLVMENEGLIAENVKLQEENRGLKGRITTIQDKPFLNAIFGPKTHATPDSTPR